MLFYTHYPRVRVFLTSTAYASFMKKLHKSTGKPINLGSIENDAAKRRVGGGGTAVEVTLRDAESPARSARFELVDMVYDTEFFAVSLLMYADEKGGENYEAPPDPEVVEQYKELGHILEFEKVRRKKERNS